MKKILSVFMAAVIIMTALCITSFAADYSIKVSRSYGSGYTYVKLTANTGDIYYTTDGTVPTTKSTKYTARIKVTKPSTLRIAVAVNGKIVKRSKTNVSVRNKKPTVTETGVSNGIHTYKVKAPSSCTVYYTTDGTTPSADNGKRAGASVSFSGKRTLKFVAVRNGWKDSAVVTVEVPAETSAEEEYIAEVLRLVNIERKNAGLSALTADAGLNKAAKVRAKELPTLFSHTRPDGTSCFTVLDEQSVKYGAAAENIAAGYATPQAVVNGWMNSSGHRANILNGKYTKLGVGVVFTDDGYGVYWAQVFTN